MKAMQIKQGVAKYNQFETTTIEVLVVDGKVVSYGKALKKDEVVKILMEVRG